LFSISELEDVPIVGQAVREVQDRWPGLDRHRLIHETVRRVISWMIFDVIDQTRQRIAAGRFESVEMVRSASQPVAAFSGRMETDNAGLQEFLAIHMYRHEKVMRNMDRARRVIRDLYQAYNSDPDQLPSGWQEAGYSRGTSRLARQICDFIAGMTDRYALDEHKRLFDLDPLFR
jgi:dGTPase